MTRCSSSEFPDSCIPYLSNIFFLCLFLFIEFIGVSLVKKTIQVSALALFLSGQSTGPSTEGLRVQSPARSGHMQSMCLSHIGLPYAKEINKPPKRNGSGPVNHEIGARKRSRPIRLFGKQVPFRKVKTTWSRLIRCTPKNVCARLLPSYATLFAALAYSILTATL